MSLQTSISYAYNRGAPVCTAISAEFHGLLVSTNHAKLKIQLKHEHLYRNTVCDCKMLKVFPRPAGVAIFTRNPLYIEELVIHTVLTRSGSGLCCAVCVPWLQDELIQVMTAQKPTSRCHVVPAIRPPAWPSLCLTEQQNILMWTSFLFDSRNK